MLPKEPKPDDQRRRRPSRRMSIASASGFDRGRHEEWSSVQKDFIVIASINLGSPHLWLFLRGEQLYLVVQPPRLIRSCINSKIRSTGVFPSRAADCVDPRTMQCTGLELIYQIGFEISASSEHEERYKVTTVRIERMHNNQDSQPFSFPTPFPEWSRNGKFIIWV